MPPKVPTYFSHSYRENDRRVNLYFWKLFWDASFAFTVAPQSGRFSVPHLELMMRRSACFVAVATHRAEQPRYQTSPFQVFEYGLAVQADKPRLVFIERHVAGSYFEDSRTIVFARGEIPDDGEPYVPSQTRHAIELLLERSAAHLFEGHRALGSVGLLLPQDESYRKATPAITDLLRQAGYRPENVKYDTDNSYEFILEVDRHDFIVIDVGSAELPAWLHPLLSGRMVPMVRLLHHEPGRQPDRPLPETLRGDAIELVAASYELAIWWSDIDDLIFQLQREVERLKRPRTQFRTRDEGEAYINSLGRSIEGAVFVSNAGRQNDFAQKLGHLLDLNNIPFFHYVYRNTIELGTDWAQRLRGRLEASQLFVPLITRSYWESEICCEEFKIAEELKEQNRLLVYPYFLEDMRDVPGPKVNIQGRTLTGLPLERQLTAIVHDIDDFLTPKRHSERAEERPSWADDPEPQVDVAFITVLREEYQAVLRHLVRHRSAPGTAQRPNQYSWELGEIAPADGGRSYRVVLGLAGQKGTSGGLLVVRNTIEAFRPAYVLLVGIAGGLGPARRGDVVVSDRIYGYEYGKVDDGFHPRPDWSYPTDTAVITAAQTMEVRSPRWYEGMIHTPAHGAWPPRIHVGHVASGNKVIDDLSDPTFKPVLDHWPGLIAVEMEGVGAAEAIKDARESGHVVNFAMVRGISDRPRSVETRRVVKVGNGPSSQTQERDRWKVAAAEAAAALSVQMIRLVWSRPPRP